MFNVMVEMSDEIKELLAGINEKAL